MLLRLLTNFTEIINLTNPIFQQPHSLQIENIKAYNGIFS